MNQRVEQPWITEVLSEPDWRERQQAHRERHAEFLEREVKRRSQHRKDPTMDFMFEYYNYSPADVLRWTPGFGVLLQGAGAKEFLKNSRYVECESGVYLSLEQLVHRRRAITWVRDLLQTTTDREPFYGCYCIHEWALLYHSKLLHPTFELRVSPEDIAAHVESGPIQCTHFEAYRFFSDQAKALCEVPLDRNTMMETEQSGCLHTNMDLFRWSYKLAPWVSGELVAGAFEVACKARTLDSSTCPYDLTPAGLQPTPIETEKGRELFVERQKAIRDEAMPLRRSLLDLYNHILHWMDEPWADLLWR